MQISHGINFSNKTWRRLQLKISVSTCRYEYLCGRGNDKEITKGLDEKLVHLLPQNTLVCFVYRSREASVMLIKKTSPFVQRAKTWNAIYRGALSKTWQYCRPACQSPPVSHKATSTEKTLCRLTYDEPPGKSEENKQPWKHTTALHSVFARGMVSQPFSEKMIFEQE